MKNKEKIKQFLMSSDERNQYLGLRLAIQTGMHISEIADIVFNYGWGKRRRSNGWSKEFLGYRFILTYYLKIKHPSHIEVFCIYVHGLGNIYKWQVPKYMQRFYPEFLSPDQFQIMDTKQMSIDVLTEIINSL